MTAHMLKTSVEEKLLLDALALKNALRKHGAHRANCPKAHYLITPLAMKCTCGLEDLLAIDPERHFE